VLPPPHEPDVAPLPELKIHNEPAAAQSLDEAERYPHIASRDPRQVDPTPTLHLEVHLR
jgi:hypothetical protein